MEPELWFTKLLNDYLPGVANAILVLFHVHPENPARPWVDFVSMQIVVAIIMVVLFAVLRSRLSVEKPGHMQHTFELLHNFIVEQGEEVIGHHDAARHLAFAGTIFLFVCFANLLGLIPGFESPTMYRPGPVPAGCAMATFLYYHVEGVRSQGAFRYLLHFGGTVWALWPLMFVIEIISHLARVLSLTIRLFANMFAGEQITVIFLGLAPVLAPAVFMGLHAFVGLIQAYIFMLLTMVYVEGAVVVHEH